MTDRVKTSLFSILDPFISDARVVDLFAGTGGLGIEALSRGAAFCTFVERDRFCVKTIHRNLERTKLADRSRIVAADVRVGIRSVAEGDERADIVLFDPPFRMGKAQEREGLRRVVEAIAADVLAPDGLLVYHHEVDTQGDMNVPELVQTDQRRYSRNVITFLRRTQ